MAIYNHGLPIRAINAGGIDTSADTVTPDMMLEGITAHDASGEQITGTIQTLDDAYYNYNHNTPEMRSLPTKGKYCAENIKITPRLQNKVPTTAGVVTADDGYAGLKSVDTTAVFEAGKKSEYDAFWDAFQDYGNRRSYDCGFAGQGWTDATFNPKYDIVITSAGIQTFHGSRVNDILAVCERNGIVIDTSKATEMFQTFYNSYTRRLGIIDASSSRNINYIFGSSPIQYIEKLIIHENCDVSYAFGGSWQLKDITIEGTIGKGNLDTAWSPLSKNSIISFINALSPTTSGLVATFRLNAVNKEFETSEGANDGSTSAEWTALVATKSNWTISLANK